MDDEQGHRRRLLLFGLIGTLRAVARQAAAYPDSRVSAQIVGTPAAGR
jgi:hypothetical protein